MRLIGSLPNEQDARRLEDYLLTQKIPCQVQTSKDGWAIWIRDEDHRDRAKEFFTQFSQNPSDERYGGATAAAQEIRREEGKEEKQRSHNLVDLRARWQPVHGPRPLTFSLIAISVVVTVLTSLEQSPFSLRNRLSMTQISPEDRYFPGLPEVQQGQIWRLITPIFVHKRILGGIGILHILFNMFWLRDLGGIIETRISTVWLAILVTVSAVVSNFAQYYVVGPNFGGMSGVVYALLGYLWMKSKYDTRSGLFLHPNTVLFMMIWFFLCWLGFVGSVANMAHTGGLAVGLAFGISRFAWRKLSQR